MLQIATDKVCYILTKARALDAKVEVVEPDPGSNATDDHMAAVLEDYPEDATRDELTEFIESLNEDEQIDLVALAWTGRGDFSAEEWPQARAEAVRGRNDNTSGYLLGMPLLPDYLEIGLSLFDQSCRDVEIAHL